MHFQVLHITMAAILYCNNDDPSLQSLALDVFFEEVLSKVTPETVDTVRSTLDQHLIGKVKKNVRYYCTCNHFSSTSNESYVYQGELCQEVL